MGKKARKKQTVRLGKNSVSFDIDPFANGSHVDYSGFGFHKTDKDRVKSRRSHKLEEKRVRYGNYD
jgi:hypothetical protein